MALPEPPIYPDLKGKVVLITGVGQQGDPEMVRTFEDIMSFESNR